MSGLFSLVIRSIAFLEYRYDNDIAFKANLIDLHGGLQLVMNKKIVQDAAKNKTVYKMSNDEITFVVKIINPATQENNIEKMAALHDFLAAREMSMLYIQAPGKVDKFASQLPAGIEDYTNSNADTFLDGLKEAGVPYLDLRDEIHDDGLDYDQLFFNTDHHWKIETAFYAYTKVMDYLKKIGDLDSGLQYKNMSYFKRFELKKSFLGSQGKRVGKFYAGVDDFAYLLPRFATDYHVQVFNDDGSIKSDRKGSFLDSIISSDCLSRSTTIETDRYAAYGGNYPLTKIINHRCSAGKILIIKDSFGLPFSAFASLNFKETDLIDLRKFKKMNLIDHLENNRYDLILFIISPAEVGNNKQFQFQAIS